MELSGVGPFIFKWTVNANPPGIVYEAFSLVASTFLKLFFVLGVGFSLEKSL